MVSYSCALPGFPDVPGTPASPFLPSIPLEPGVPLSPVDPCSPFWPVNNYEIKSSTNAEFDETYSKQDLNPGNTKVSSKSVLSSQSCTSWNVYR